MMTGIEQAHPDDNTARRFAETRGDEPRSIRGAAAASPGRGRTDDQGLAKLRDAADQVVGSVFYGTLLRTMRSSQLKGPYGHGGRGEEIFGAQLDQVLAERSGRARGYGLTEAVVRQLAEQQFRVDRAAGKTEPEAVQAAQSKTEMGRVPA
jgi:Rod binding domain-containing protein